MSYDKELLASIVEAALLAAAQPLNSERLLALFEEEELQPTKEEILEAITELQTDNHYRGIELKEVASGWRFQVRSGTARWVNRLWEEKPQKYSRALLETLALIAYRQPITRGDIEDIRGVSVSSNIIKTLTEREWVRVVGHRDVPGRPALYATTRQFLDYFNLKNLEDLPTLSELADGMDESDDVTDVDSIDTEANAEGQVDDLFADGEEAPQGSDDQPPRRAALKLVTENGVEVGHRNEESPRSSSGEIDIAQLAQEIISSSRKPDVPTEESSATDADDASPSPTNQDQQHTEEDDDTPSEREET